MSGSRRLAPLTRDSLAELPGPCNEIVPEPVSVRATHLASCHRSDDLEGVTVDELRAQADEEDLLVEDVVVDAP